MSTLISTIQGFCEFQALPSPSVVIGSTDTQVIQERRILEVGGVELAQRGPWEKMTFEVLHTTINNEDQGEIASIAATGFGWFLINTFWDRTDRVPLIGPVSAREWQYLMAIVVTGPRYSFRIRGGHLLVTPAPPAGHTWAFEYVSNNWITDSTGAIYKSAFTADDDIILLPQKIVDADLLWRWRKTKGLVYDEDFNSCERLVVNALGRDGGKRTLYLHDNEFQPRPGIFIPAGNWPL